MKPTSGRINYAIMITIERQPHSTRIVHMILIPIGTHGTARLRVPFCQAIRIFEHLFATVSNSIVTQNSSIVRNRVSVGRDKRTVRLNEAGASSSLSWRPLHRVRTPLVMSNQIRWNDYFRLQVGWDWRKLTKFPTKTNKRAGIFDMFWDTERLFRTGFIWIMLGEEAL